METPASLIESLIERAETYGKTTYELSKLKALEAATHLAASLLSRLSIILVLFLFVIVLNIGIALLVGELLGKAYYGFFIVAVFYLIAGFVFYFFLHKWIKKPVSDLIIKQVLQ